MRDWPAILAIAFTMLSGLIAGSMRFSSLETRVDMIESVGHKLEVIDERLARIEGKIEEWKK